MNSACDCCNSYFFDSPIIESRFSWIVRPRCAFKINGEFYKVQNKQFICTSNPSITYIEKRTLNNTEQFLNPEIQFPYGQYCIATHETNPPEKDWEFPCNSIFNYTYVDGSINGEEPYPESDYKQQVLNTLSYAPWYTESGGDEGFLPVPMGAAPRTTYNNSYLYDDWSYAEKSEYRIVHNPYPSCYLKVWIGEITYANDIIVNDITREYVWSPTYSPCIPNNNKPFYHEENKIISEIFKLNPSGTNEITFAFLKKWSYLKDYEPDDPIILDQFMAYRPIPDCKPNGLPDPTIEC